MPGQAMGSQSGTCGGPWERQEGRALQGAWDVGAHGEPREWGWGRPTSP